MKKIAIIAAAILATSSTFAQTTSWSLDKAHSRLGFSIGYLGISDIDGSFKSTDITVTAAKADFSDASVELTADVNSINTESDQRDGHLKSADFFDAAKFGTFTFKSTSTKKVSDKHYKVTGDLTLHGVTKTVVLDLVYNGTTTNPMSKKQIAGFKVTGPIKRSEFGIGAGFPAPMLSDVVNLDANIILVAAN